MERLGLLMIDRRLIGHMGRIRLRASYCTLLLIPILLGEPALGLASRAERNTVEPVAQQIGVSNGAHPAGQYEEDGLEGILGVLVVAEGLPAYASEP